VAEYAMWCRRFDDISRWTGPGAENVRQQIDQAENRVKQAIELAEAAMEHCEAVYWSGQFEGKSEEVHKTYNQWLELRESKRESGVTGKEWWNAK
jgi:hypothetical protein